VNVNKEIRRLRAELIAATNELHRMRDSLNVRFTPEGDTFAVYAGDEQVSDWARVPDGR
jgi:hypothetical protein